MIDTMQTYDNDLAYMFDGAIAERVVALLNVFDIPAEVEEYEPGMHQIRLDPVDGSTQSGWIAVAGQGNDMTLGWFAIRTTRYENGHGFEPMDFFEPVSLNLPISAEPGQVAPAIMALLRKCD